MTPIERLGMGVLFRLQPETAHDLSIRALASGLVPLAGGPVTSPRLRTRLAGKVDTDLDTARRLFTLICALHWRG